MEKRFVNWDELKKRADELFSPCRLCVRRCGARRRDGVRGVCGAGDSPRLDKFFINYGEEPVLNPAYMLYFIGCDLACAYCSRADAGEGREWSAVDAADAADTANAAFRAGKIRTVQILGGEPSCSLPAALEFAGRLEAPAVWNSNFTWSPEAGEIIAAAFDYYVADLKFGNDRCASELAGIDGYWACVTGNLRSVPRDRLLIRHLPLGGHLTCCAFPVIDFLRENFPDTPVGFHTLIPDRAGRTRSLTASELQGLDGRIAAAGLRRVRSELRSAPDGHAAAECEIMLRADGSIVLQDLSAPVRKILEGLI